MSSGRPPITKEEVNLVVDAYMMYGNNAAEAARSLNMTASSFHRRLQKSNLPLQRNQSNIPEPEPFEINKDDLHDEVADLDEIISKRKKEFQRRDNFEKSRNLINCRVRIDGPIGILHLGDPHVDDPGTSIDLLESHVKLVSDTEGLFGATVGDLANHWVGRLASLHAHQTTTEAETWKLVEWLVTSINWLYIIGGNHDLWVGNGDPIQWMVRKQSGVYEAHGARIGLMFPNKKEVRIHARHDWSGHSQWNSAHGPAKAAQMGHTDHVLISGHRHISGYQIIKQPTDGLVTHAIRVASYKIHDNYAKQLGLKNQNLSPSVLTIVQPEKDDNDAGLVTVFHDIETGVDFLNFLRRKDM